jgi:hypothetical protein
VQATRCGNLRLLVHPLLTRLYKTSVASGANAPIQWKGPHSSACKQSPSETPGEKTRINLPKTPEVEGIAEEARLLWLQQWKWADRLLHTQGYEAVLSKQATLLMSVDDGMSNEKGITVGPMGLNTITLSPMHPLGAKLLVAQLAARSDLPKKNKTKRNAIISSVVLLSTILLAVYLERTWRESAHFKVLADKILLENIKLRRITSKAMKTLVVRPEDDPLTIRVKAVLAKVIEPSGLEAPDWGFILVDAPCEYQSL